MPRVPVGPIFMMRSFFRSSFKLAMVVAFVLGLALTAEAKPKKVLLVTVTIGFHHTSTVVAEKIIPMLGEKGGWTVDIVKSGPEPKDPTAKAAWLEKARTELAAKMNTKALKQYDAVIFANTTGVLPIPDKEAFLNWIKSGKAFIGTHSASDTFQYPK